MSKWREGIATMEGFLADPEVTEYIVHAYSDPEKSISLVARDVPPHGYRCYWVRGTTKDFNEQAKLANLNPILQGLLPIATRVIQSPVVSKIIKPRKKTSSKKGYQIENDFFVVTAKPGRAGISVNDKRLGITFSELNQLIDGSDCGDLYNYCPTEKDRLFTASIRHIEVEERKSYQRLSCHYDLRIPSSITDDRKSRSEALVINPVVSTFTLVRGVPRIDVHTEIDNFSKDHRQRVHFPAPFTTSHAYHDGHFEIVQRPIGIPQFDETWEEPPRPEVPQCQFSSIADTKTSLTIANRGLPEVEVFNNLSGKTEIAITLLRCIGWLSRDDIATRKGHAGPMGVSTPGAQMLGKHAFDYSIIPGDSHWQDAIPHAFSFNTPLQSMTSPIHPGALASDYSLLNNSNQSFIITSIKPPEKGPGMIMRGFNMLPSPIEVTLQTTSYLQKATLVSLDENPIKAIPVSSDGNIQIKVDGHKIVTILLTP
jgi:alpha-mannosidase